MREDIVVLIIEDEPLWAKSISMNLDDFGFGVVDVAADFESAVLALNRRNYDIVLLDIHLNGRETGIELGKMISALYKKPFIFITASFEAETAQKAVAASPSAYLTKPVHPASLFATIQTAIQNFSQKTVPTAPAGAGPEDAFFVKQGDRYKKIFWKEVICLRSEKNYTGVVNNADQATYFIRSTLPRTLRYLVPPVLQNSFLQINRSEAVQLSFIRELVKDEVVTDHRRFSVSESHLKELKEKLHILG